MHKIVTLFTAVCLLLSFSACKKEDKKLNCRLTDTYTAGDSVHITYDAQGRVSVYAYPDLGTYYTYTYSGLSAQCVLSTPSNPSLITYNLFLNSDGTVASMLYTRLIGSSTVNYTFNFKYNSEGRIRLCEQQLNDVTIGAVSFKLDSMVYVNGNLSAQFTYNAASPTGPFYFQESTLTTYTEYDNTISYHPFSIYEEPMTLLSGLGPFYHLYGKGSSKLPLETSVYNDLSVLNFKMSYNYLFDENGNVQEQNQVRTISLPSASNKRFYYTCE